MTIGQHTIRITLAALGIVSNAGHGVKHFRIFGFLDGKPQRQAWAECGDVSWRI